MHVSGVCVVMYTWGNIYLLVVALIMVLVCRSRPSVSVHAIMRHNGGKVLVHMHPFYIAPFTNEE